MCTLKSCQDTHYVHESSTTCKQGNWTTELKCASKNLACNSGSIPVIENGVIECEEDNGIIPGGSICGVSCDAGYIQNGEVRCVDGLLTETECGKYKYRKRLYLKFIVYNLLRIAFSIFWEIQVCNIFT